MSSAAATRRHLSSYVVENGIKTRKQKCITALPVNILSSNILEHKQKNRPLVTEFKERFRSRGETFLTQTHYK